MGGVCVVFGDDRKTVVVQAVFIGWLALVDDLSG